MKIRSIFVGLALAGAAMPLAAAAEDIVTTATADAAPAVVAPAAPVATPLNLAANTPITLTLNSGLTTKSNLTGEKFGMTVAQDVMVDGKVVVPKGTRAVGLITYAKPSGSFGKSGKMELAFKYLELGGRQIPLDGTYYQEGEGNGAATVGAVFAAGVIGGLVVKGHSVEFVAGKEFGAFLGQDVPFLVDGASIGVDAGFQPAAVNMQTETEKERKRRLKAAEKAAKG